MLIINNASEIQRINNPTIQELVALRFRQLNSPDGPDCEPVEIVVVEAGDSVPAIEQATGIPILTGLFDDLPFGHPEYVPPTEFIERHLHDNAITFELFNVASDSGAGTALFIPDEEGINADLLAMCRSFSTPAMNTP